MSKNSNLKTLFVLSIFVLISLICHKIYRGNTGSDSDRFQSASNIARASAQAHHDASQHTDLSVKRSALRGNIASYWQDITVKSSRKIKDIPDPLQTVGTPEHIEVVHDENFKYPNIRLEKDQEGEILSAMVADHLLVQVKKGIPHKAFVESLEAARLQLRKTIIPMQLYVVILDKQTEVEPNTLEEIRDRLQSVAPLLSSSEPDYIVYSSLTPNDSDFGLLWGMYKSSEQPNIGDINAQEAWDIATDASSIVVGVIDTGIDYNHEDLAANMWTNTGEIPGNDQDDDSNGFVDDVHGFDFYNDDADPMDDHYHGTHCAGTIGARGNNSKGVAGVAWSSRLMALKFLSESGRGTTSDAIAAITYAYNNGAQITSNSWGGGAYSASLRAAIETPGKLFVAAAGNSARNTDSAPAYPAAYNLDNIISVAASDKYDELAVFSNYGYESVDVAAPGVSIYSSMPGDTYGMLSGTSMAAPHVSGACALLLAQDTSLTPAQVKLHLMQSADPVSSLTSRVKSGGRLNLERLLLGDSEGVPVIASLLVGSSYLDQAYTYQIVASSNAVWFSALGLPQGLTLDPTTGEISGGISTEGVYDITIGAGNAKGLGTATLTLTVTGQAPEISSSLAVSAQQNKFFFHEITTSPRATSFAASNLPNGLSINTSAGVISGYPEESGTFNIGLAASNLSGTDEETLIITIALPDPPEITSALEVSGVLENPFSYQIKASNSPSTYGAQGLPPGLDINEATGEITGVPIVSGQSIVIISVTNAGGNDQASLQITINVPDAPVITSGLQVQGQVGEVFSYRIGATNAPTAYNATHLPAGLSVVTETGVISGIPTASGYFEVLLSAENAGGKGSSSLQVEILPEAPEITSSTSLQFIINQPVSYPITSNPTADSYGAVNLPAGLSVNTATGVVSGSISHTGTSSFVVSATNAGGTGSANITMTIVPEAPVIDGGDLNHTYEAGALVDVSVNAANTPTSFSATNLPEGLFMDSSTGRITGTLSTIDTYTFQVSATNAGGTGSATMVIEIIQGPTRITSFSPTEVNPHGTVTITGVGFTDATEVYFSSRFESMVAAESFTVISDTQLEAQVPYLQMIHDNDLSWIIINTPQGMAVAYPPSSIEVIGGYDAGGSGGRHLVVREGGALISGGGGGHKVVIEKGGAARLGGGGGHTFFVASGGFLDLSEIGTGHQIYHAKDALILNQPSLEATAAMANPGFTIVKDIRVTIMDQLLRVRQLPQISSATEDAATIGQSYLYRIDADNVPGNNNMTYGAGALPPGLTFDTATGVISGYPTTAGVSVIDLSVTNAEGTTHFTLTLTVTGDPVPVISGVTKIEGNSGESLSYSITAFNNPTSYGATGLPAGLAIVSQTGVISGIPATGGVYTATLSATNAYGTTTRDVTFFIDASSLAITSFAPVSIASGTDLTVSGRGMEEVTGAYFISRLNGAVAGTHISASTDGELTVITPSLNHQWYSESPLILTSPSRSCVSFPNTVLTMAASGTISASYTLVPSGVNAVTSGSGARKIYVESGGSISTSGGGGGHLIFLEDGATAEMSGGGGGHLVFKSPSATVIGSTTVVPVSSLSLSIVSHDMLNVFDLPVISTSDATGNVGETFSYQIESTARPGFGRTYGATHLPSGLLVDTSSGLISGTPTLSGEYDVELSITETNGTSTKTVVFTIGNAPLPAVSSAYRLDVSVGEAINHQITATNSPTLFAATNIPTGLSISSSGLVSGQLSAPGVWSIPVEMTNAHGSSSYMLLIAVDTPPPSVTTMPATTASGATLTLQGTHLDHVESVYFTDRNSWNSSGVITSQSATELSVTTPSLVMIHQPGSLLTLIGPGGATVLIPDTITEVTGSSSGGGGSYLRIRSGGVLSGGGGGMTIYADTGSHVAPSGGGGQLIFAENGAVVDLTDAGGSNTVVHAPNAIIKHSNNVNLIPVSGLVPSPVSDFLQILPLPTINSPGSARAYLNIPFYYAITAQNSPTSYGATALPSGLSFDGDAGTISGYPTEVGNFSLQISATNSDGTSTRTLSLTVGDPYDYWKETQFTSLDGGSANLMASDSSDPDKDGINNLLEFATNSNPLSPDSARAIVEQLEVVNGQFEYTYNRRKGIGSGDTINGYTIDGIRFTLEASDDMVTWNSGPAHFDTVGSPVDNGDGTESVTVCLKQAITDAKSAFIRVMVERVDQE